MICRHSYSQCHASSQTVVYIKSIVDLTVILLRLGFVRNWILHVKVGSHNAVNNGI